VPKIEGDAVERHPAIAMCVIVGGSLAGPLGAILAPPIAASNRDLLRHLSGRLSPDDDGRMEATIANLGSLPPGRASRTESSGG
jgi:predicted PurR-regulated permease PerM